MLGEHAELEQRLGEPETHADARLAKRLNRRYAELSSLIGVWREWQRLGEDAEAARELAGEDPAFAEEATELDVRREDGRRATAPAAGAARGGRREGRAARGEVRRGRRGVGALRRRPAADVHPLRRAARVERRGARRHRVRPRRLQVGDRRGQGEGHPAAGGGALRPAEVRGRGAPGAAGAGDRVPGSRPHQCGGRPGAARGRAGRRQHRRQRPAHRRLPLQRSRRAEREHHRLRGPDHPRAHAASWPAARTRRASCRTRSRPCASCGSRLLAVAEEAAAAEASDARRSQVRTVDRSERIRTYNYPENRISDHRTGYKSYNLDQVLDGDLGAGARSRASTPTWPRGSPRWRTE